MSVFRTLNEDIFGVIGGFLSPKVFLQLCLTSNDIYKETKSVKYLKLNKKYSLKFYEDARFRKIVLSSINNPSRQLSLALYHCENVRDVSVLAGVHTLNLSDWHNVRDGSALGGVHTLDLSNCGISWWSKSIM